MNEIIKNVLSTVIGAAIVAGFGYVLVVKENQIKIEELQNAINQQSINLAAFSDRQDVAINSIRLFVVSNHPNKDHSTLLSQVSLRKLQGLSPEEYPILVRGLNNIVEPGDNPPQMTADFSQLLLEHNLEEADLNRYVAELKLKKP
ncbi:MULTISPECIES: hypothetical protein [Vibrio]|uniref:hypothetical protein n=1 Tax=Vibrio TaxID=662 RepID=UPI00076A2160|nr:MULTISPECIES: hypothetical protein [Vibrio]